MQVSTHNCFPAPYKASVRSLLLAHKVLERLQATTCATNPPGAVATRALWAASAAKRSATTPPASPGRPRSALIERSHGPPLMCPASKRACGGSGAWGVMQAGMTHTTVVSTPPRARHPGALCAYSDGGDTPTASISIVSAESPRFTATVTVTSPRRAHLTSTVNIAMSSTTLAGGSHSRTVAISSSSTALLGGDAALLHTAAPGCEAAGMTAMLVDDAPLPTLAASSGMLRRGGSLIR